MFKIRAYEPDEDLNGLYKLLTAVEEHDQDGEDISIEALRQQLTWRNHNPRHDCFVVEQPHVPASLIGYASLSGRTGTRCTVYAVVHPNWRRQGLGTQLLDRAHERAEKSGSNKFIVYANGQNIGSNAFLKQRCYQSVGASWILSASVKTSFAQPFLPDGFSILSYAQVEQPAALLADILNRGYGDMWGHAQNETLTTVESLSENIPAYWQPKHIFILFANDGDTAGICLGKPGEKEHILEGPGVAPEYRHLELQRPLTLTVAHHLQTIRQNPIQLLSYGDDETTIEIYQQIGFQLSAHYIVYQGDLIK